MKKPKLHILHLQNYSIFQQLQLEEALLRADSGNWCILNRGSPPAIVMGISGQLDVLVDKDQAKFLSLPIIRRFSGGGTVVVDQDTLFATFICNSLDVGVVAFPEKILHWTRSVYREVFSGLDFQLQEHDYTLGNRKCGGNAQYIQKERWLHHTTFLWDYCSSRMNVLLHPKKTPSYRENRSHEQFICKLKNYISDKEKWISELAENLENYFEVCQGSLRIAEEMLLKPHRRSTEWILKE